MTCRFTLKSNMSLSRLCVAAILHSDLHSDLQTILCDLMGRVIISESLI